MVPKATYVNIKRSVAKYINELLRKCNWESLEIGMKKTLAIKTTIFRGIYKTGNVYGECLYMLCNSSWARRSW